MRGRVWWPRPELNAKGPIPISLSAAVSWWEADHLAPDKSNKPFAPQINPQNGCHQAKV